MASFAPEVFLEVGKLPVTNTVLNTILVDGFLILLALSVRSKLALIPGKFQSIIEYVIGGLYNFVASIAEKRAQLIFPFFMTFFLFILVANWSALVPGLMTFGKIEYSHEIGHEGEMHIIPLLRPTTSDLNTTLALAIVSLLATHIMSIRALGFTEYISRFLPFIPFLISLLKGKPKINIDTTGPVNMIMSVFNPFVLIFVGGLELISEFVKVVSLSFRLFGNIYAGEVVLETVSGIFAFLFPLPFLLLEVIVGVVQALVFSMLTMAFMIILTTPHHEESEEVSH